MDFEGFFNEMRTNMYNHRMFRHNYLTGLMPYPGVHPQRDNNLHVFHEVERWLLQAARIDEAFPGFFERVIRNPHVPEEDIAPFVGNYRDELGRGDSNRHHFRLFLNLFRSMDITEERYRSSRVLPATQNLIDEINRACEGSDILRMYALLASEELLCPAEFRYIVNAMDYMRKTLGLNVDMEYFDVHINTDPRHAEELARVLWRGIRGNVPAIIRAYVVQAEDMDMNNRFYDDLQEQVARQLLEIELRQRPKDW